MASLVHPYYGYKLMLITKMGNSNELNDCLLKKIGKFQHSKQFPPAIRIVLHDFHINVKIEINKELNQHYSLRALQ